MMNADADNFMKQHLKLRYTKGHVWLYLKAETREDSEMMLKVITTKYNIMLKQWSSSYRSIIMSRLLWYYPVFDYSHNSLTMLHVTRNIKHIGSS